MRRTRWKAALLLTLVVPAGVSAAQDGALSGTVTDTTGLVLPGVTVEARAPDDEIRTTVTDGAGTFTLGALAPGI
ncbi:MAG: carboxypeptidase-like regulatory domain-containing protein [Acidobacteria bacterium]|nr:carboxypeptidase-like regulatory domain-containing protein [Acidobacteriota bacterium]